MSHSAPLEDNKVADLQRSIKVFVHDDAELTRFCSPLTLQRYLQAHDGQVEPALKRLRSTLEWRKSFRPQDISFQEIQPLAGTGRLEVLEHRDLEGRPVLCYRLRRPNVGGLPPDQHLRFMLFNLEAASKLADENGVGKMTWLMDMDNYDNSQSIPIMTVRKIINILQAHYPERLGLILIMRANSIFKALYFVIKHFLDPVTRKKLVFLDDMDDARMKQSLLQYISPALLEAAFSCRNPDVAFDLAKYEARMVQLQKQP